MSIKKRKNFGSKYFRIRQKIPDSLCPVSFIPDSTLYSVVRQSVPTAAAVIIYRIRPARRRIHSGHSILARTSRHGLVITGHSGFRSGSLTAAAVPADILMSAAVFFALFPASAATTVIHYIMPFADAVTAAPSAPAAENQYQQIKTIHRIQISLLDSSLSPVCPLTCRL